MNQQELEAKLEQGRVWLASQREAYLATGVKHPRLDEQQDKFNEFWSELDEIKKGVQKLL
jgi:hypothetical protein